MASRMERYSKTEKTTYTSGRSDRNKSLYKQIEDLDGYTNIAGIATIENKNSIDLEKVKQLIKSKEEKEEIRQKIPEEKEELIEETRNYDIKSLLAQVKENQEDKKYRSLSAKQHELLRQLNKKNQELKEEELEIDELVKTISNMKSITEEDYTDDVGLFDDLKSDTMIGDAPSIKQIIEEEKQLTKEFDDIDVDKSFYTSSFGFTQRDFEELKDINHKIKKDNKFIIILLIILILLIVIGSVFLIVK